MKTTLRSLGTALVLSLVALAPMGCEEDTGTGDEQNVTEITGRFETFKGADGQTYFQLIAKNGERILRSEAYTSLSSAKKGITSVKKNGVLDEAFEVLEADNGEFYFNLVAANGETIGTSELYTTKQGAEGGVGAVKKALAAPASAAAETGGPRFETFKGADGKSYFRLRAGNGQIVLQSQGYSSKSAADKGITSVKTNAIDSTNFEIIEGADGQHTFRLVAQNGQIIGRGEMYSTKSNAFRGADTVRDIVREITKKTTVSDADIKAEIEKAADGLLFISESDYPFTFVSAPLGAGKPVDEAAIRAAFASIVDADEDADKPLAELFAMEETWEEWKASEVNCSDTSDEAGLATCMQMRSLESVLESNLTDVKVFYFGANGEPGQVDGTAVSVFIVGRSPSGALVGVRTIAIWT